MDEAFVQHSEDDVHRDQGGSEKQRHVRERSLENLSCALKAALHGGGHVQFLDGPLDNGGGLTQRDIRVEIERECD